MRALEFFSGLGGWRLALGTRGAVAAAFDVSEAANAAYALNHGVAPRARELATLPLAELLAQAWGGLPATAADPRLQAQQWLQQAGYVPTRITVANPFVTLAGALLPWLHTDDHPPEALQHQQFDVSMPAAIEAFVRQQLPEARRIEFCHDQRQMVVRQGWVPLAAGCQAAPGDRVITLPAAPAPAAGA